MEKVVAERRRIPTPVTGADAERMGVYEKLEKSHQRERTKYRAGHDARVAKYNQTAAYAAANPVPAPGIFVTAGPITQPYDILGPVHVDTRGVINLGSVLTDSLFRSRLATSIQRTPDATIPQMNELLKQQAVRTYGGRVSAVINVTYRTDPDGDVSADGLAVAFKKPQPVPHSPPSSAAPKSAGERLKELNELKDDGLLRDEEYEQKRREIIDEL